MKKRIVDIACGWCGSHAMDAFDAAPGLIVHSEFPCSIAREGLWFVTHERSQHVVTGASDPETAMFLANVLAKECDWTVTGAALRERWGTYGSDLYRIVPRLPGHPYSADPERLSA